MRYSGGYIIESKGFKAGLSRNKHRAVIDINYLASVFAGDVF